MNVAKRIMAALEEQKRRDLGLPERPPRYHELGLWAKVRRLFSR